MIPYLKLLLLFWMFKFIKRNRYIPILLVVILAFTLRFYQVNKLPPGLYDDEVSLGYNAYSLLTHGTDEYGVAFPLWFKAFGEYKLPGYIYADIVSIAIFGKNELGVRLPSVLFGTLTVLFLYLFLKDLLSLSSKTLEDKFNILPLISAFVLAITPWHMQFSRGAYESVVAVCFFIIGCWQFTKFYKKKKILNLIASIFFLTLASYTYNSFRILTPLTLLVVFYILLKTKYSLKNIIYLLFCALLLNIPLLLFTLTSQGYTRFQQTSTFTQQSLSTPSLQSPLLNFIAYPFIYLKNYLSYFSLQELFVKAQDNVRFYSSTEFGFLFRWQLFFLIVGFIVLLRENWGIFKKVTLGILLIVPAVGAVTISPNALRSLLLVIPFSIITAIGIHSIVKHTSLWVKTVFVAIILLGIYETGLYFHMYLSHYQNAYAIFWGGAQKRIVTEATNYSKRYSIIIINENMLPNEKIYFLFYDDKLKPIFVNSSWQKPKEWTSPVLLIRYPLALPNDSKMKLLKTVALDTPLKQEVAQFIEL
jgi:4-amino-4-deoxy-L-arabinose transferase-like glycosyltransferase